MEAQQTTVQARDRIDLHLHTTYSDGHWAPGDLFDHLAAEHFRVVAVTDHDRTDRLTEMRDLGAARGITVIPGVEVTTDWQGRMAHVLCYGFASEAGHLARLTQGIRAEQTANARMVHAALIRHGMSFPRQAEVLVAHGGAIEHPGDNITLLREHGYAASYQEGVATVTALGHRSASAPLDAAIAAAHADGGVALIAHPGRQEQGFTLFTPELLDDERAVGLDLDGIEVYYPLHTPEQVRGYAAYVAEHDWLASCGSDSHGPQQRYPIPYAAAQAKRLLARCGVMVSGS